MQPNSQNGQWGQQQSQYTGGYQGPPPAKKARAESVAALSTTVTTSGTVITKYAPPPGYAGPAAPQTNYPGQAWPQTAQAYSYPYAGYPGYQQAYGAAQAQQYPGYQPYPMQGYPPQAYPPQGYPQGYPPPYPGYGVQGYQYPPSAAPAASPPASTASTAMGWQQPNPWPSSASGQAPQAGRHQSAPVNAYPAPASHSRNVSITSSQAQPGAAPTPEAVESAYDDDCYWAEHPDEIVPELSLGMIESHYALPTARPIPATFKEAELEALAPRAQDSNLSGCISEYYAEGHGDEQLNSIRGSSAWTEVQDDIIFKDFLAVGFEILAREEILSRYRNRTDPHFVIPVKLVIAPPSRGLERRTHSTTNGNGHARTESRRNLKREMSADDPLGDLESALRDDHDRANSVVSHHSRASSVASDYSQRSTRPKQLPKINDPRQDELLKALGVEGSPKTVYETPGPALGPRPSSVHSQSNSKDHSRDHSRDRERQEYSARRAPPPPSSRYNDSRDRPRREDDHYRSDSNGRQRNNSRPYDDRRPYANGRPRDDDRLHANDHSQNNGRSHINSSNHRPSSANSQHTMAGSDFEGGDDMDLTPRPKYDRTDSRKRSYHEVEEHARRDDRKSEGNDDTPRQKYKQARTVSDAYRRRW
ncbi:hypothetical protein B0A48_16373 [Cryoendolithus antarcticus]|uniref:Uncharacterized protein n=1 Tax=Cryoendolithus antarcticus TaxID=1507870 RepID=A0A1V8SE17_9PEZI|nr:hypothetical protein B0A48_16373 [Cryoendolithus antarcticus]